MFPVQFIYELNIPISWSLQTQFSILFSNFPCCLFPFFNPISYFGLSDLQLNFYTLRFIFILCQANTQADSHSCSYSFIVILTFVYSLELPLKFILVLTDNHNHIHISFPVLTWIHLENGPHSDIHMTTQTSTRTQIIQTYINSQIYNYTHPGQLNDDFNVM